MFVFPISTDHNTGRLHRVLLSREDIKIYFYESLTVIGIINVQHVCAQFKLMIIKHVYTNTVTCNLRLT